MKVYNTTASNMGSLESANRSNIGKDGFLKILAAQLQNQDPLNAKDNSEYVAQMAQFTSLEQMQNLNESMNNLLASQKVLEGNMLIGRIVTVDIGDGDFVKGVVSSARAAKGSVNLMIGGSEYSVDSVIEVEENIIDEAEPSDEGSEQNVV